MDGLTPPRYTACEDVEIGFKPLKEGAFVCEKNATFWQLRRLES